MKKQPYPQLNRRLAKALGLVLGLSIFGILPFAPQSAHADTPDTVYVGNNGTWSVSANNWTNGVPTAGTVAEFNSIYPNTGPTITGAAFAAGLWDSTGLLQNLTIGGSNLGLTLSGTATINGIANTGILMNDAGNFNLTTGQTITLGASTSFLVDNAGTLSVSALNLAGNTLTLGGTSAAGRIIISGTTTTAGALTVNTSGVVTITGSTTYTGATTVQAGTLNIGNGTSGLISNSSALSISSGATVAFDEATATGTYSNAISDAGTLVGAEASARINVLSGSITSTGAFTQFGAATGETILSSANNTFSGGLNFTGGTVIQRGDVFGGTAASQSTALTGNGGTFGFDGSGNGATTGTNQALTVNALTFASGQSTVYVASPSISSTYTLTASSLSRTAGAVALFSGTGNYNTFGGGASASNITTLASGPTYTYGNIYYDITGQTAGAMDQGTFIGYGGTNYSYAWYDTNTNPGGTTIGVRPIAYGVDQGTVTLASATTVTGTGQSVQITGAGISAQTTGTFATLDIALATNNENALTMATGNNILTVNGILVSGGVGTVAGGVAVTGTLTPTTNSEMVINVISGDTLTINGSIIANGANTVTLAGAGAVGLATGTNTFTGPIVLDGGVTLNVKNQFSLNNAPKIVFGGGVNTASVQMNTLDLTVNGLDSVSASSGVYGKNNVSLLTLINTGTDNYAGQLQANSGWGLELVKNGAGTQILSGAATVATAMFAPTAINAGVMELGNANAVQSSVVSINANNGLAFSNSMIGGDSYNIDGLAGSGNLALSDTGGSAVTLVLGGVGSNNQNPTTGMNYGGNLSGPGAFTHNNGTTAGTLSAYQPTVIQILSGSNSYTGQTTLGAASAGSILEFANKTSLYGGVTSKWNGSNIVVKTGNVLAVLLGTSPGQFGTSDLNTLLSDVETTSTSYAGFESGSVIGIDTGAGNFTYSNAIVNPSYPTATLGVTKLGSGNFTFNAANTYTGITTVDNGTLTIGAGGSLNGGSGVPLVMGGGTLALNNGSSQTFTTLAVNPGGSTFNVAASNTLGFTGAITRAAGSALNFTGAGTTNVLAASTYNGIIGGYALYGGTAFAINTAGTVGALTTYSNNLSITPSAIVDTSTGNNDVLSTSGTLSANTTINSLTITDGASGDGDTLNLNGYSLIFSQGASANQVGGILYNPGTTGNLFLITCSNGLITSGSANALQNTAQGELVVNVTPGNTLKISGNYGNSSTGGGGLTVGGGGTVQLIVSNGNGSNGTRGAIYVDYGTLQVGDGGASASLSDSAQVYIATTGTLAFDEKTNSALSMVNLVDNGMIICEQTTVATNTFNLGNTNNSGGSITGIGAFTQASGVTFSNFVGAYTGPTTITSGTLVLQNEFSVENSVVSINVNAGLAFNNLLAGNAYTIGGLSGSHNLALTDINGSPVSLTIGNNNNTGMTYSGSITGSGSLTKIGTGTQTISAGTYTGALGVQAGTLIVSGALSGVTSVSVTGGDLEVDGSVNGSAKINLSNGGELSGQGTVGTIIDPSSTLAPGLTAAGTTAGTLTTSGTVQLASTTNFDIRLGVVSSTDSDQLKTTSGAATTISLSGANLVLTLGNNFNATPGGNVFYQIINGGAGSNQVSGQFAEGTSQFTSGGSTFEIFYNVDNTDTGSGTGSYVDLELISVPEPSTWAMFIAGAGMLVCGQRARRRLIK